MGEEPAILSYLNPLGLALHRGQHRTQFQGQFGERPAQRSAAHLGLRWEPLKLAALAPADVILTNPPFGTKKGGRPTRDDFTFGHVAVDPSAARGANIARAIARP